MLKEDEEINSNGVDYDDGDDSKFPNPGLLEEKYTFEFMKMIEHECKLNSRKKMVMTMERQNLKLMEF